MWAGISMPRDSTAHAASGVAGMPWAALVPAEKMWGLGWFSGASRERCRPIASAIGLRQVLPVQTKRIVLDCDSGIVVASWLAADSRGELQPYANPPSAATRRFPLQSHKPTM